MALKQIVKEYILALLDLQKIRLECINLGFNKSKTIKAELDLIEEAKKEIGKKL